MATPLAIFLALFVFTMTAGSINVAIGPLDAPRYDIVAAADLISNTYMKTHGVPEVMAGPLSFLLLTIPAMLAFFFIRALFVNH